MDPISLTKTLVQIESTDPGAGEAGVADCLEALAKKHMPTFAQIQRQEVLPGRPLLLCTLPGKTDEELVFICHMDTVPVGDGWTKDPFGGEEENGKLYGRGSCDMKSGLAASFCAFLEAAESQTEKPNKTIKYICSMDEEADMRGVEKALELGWVTKDSLVLDCEPTDGNIETAHKGRFWFTLAIHGKAAHASRPETGADAILGMALTISEIQKRYSDLPGDAFLGKPTIAFGRIEGGTQPYQVPAECKVTIDMRAVPPTTIEDMQTLLEESAKEAQKQLPGISYTVTITGNRAPVPHNESSPLLDMVRDSVQKLTEKEAAVCAFPGYTDTAVIASRNGNPNTLSYGPGSLEQAHKPDEFVKVEEIERCYRVYQDLIRRWLA